MFRRVDLPARVPGRLLLHSMPGRYEAIESVWKQVRSEGVGAIVCLAEKDEVQQNSCEYARALEAGTVPCSVLHFAIPDRGAPGNRDAFWARHARPGNRHYFVPRDEPESRRGFAPHPNPLPAARVCRNCHFEPKARNLFFACS